MSLRILFASDAPDSSSGYANQLRLLAPRIAPHCELAILATYGHQGARREWQGIPVYPGGADPFANDVLPQAARDWKADVVITLKDTHVFQPQTFQGLRWLPMTPVDHDPIPEAIVGRIRAAAYRPIAYAPHGFRALRKAGFDPLYCPHGYDPAIFNPQSRDEARKLLGLDPAWFVVGTVAVNRGGIPSRKAWPQNLEAFAQFAKDKPDARYLCHTNIAQDGYEGGIPLGTLAAQLGIADKILFPDQERYKVGYPDAYLNALYNSIDVLNAVSLGEGFGIPTMEAQACGVPVIVGDWCAQEDLCWAGWKVEKREALRFYDSQQTWVDIPHPSAIADRMQNAYAARHEQARLRSAALAGAAAHQIDRVVADHWLPLLAEVERDIRTVKSRGVLRIVRPEEVGAA